MSDIKHLLFDDNGVHEPSVSVFPTNYKRYINSNLLESTSGTNFIFKLIKPAGLNFNLKKFNIDTLSLSNSEKRKSKLSLRLTKLEEMNFKIKFKEIRSDNLQLNLKLIDSQLPEILSYLVYYKYKTGKSKLGDLINEINLKNPLGFDLTKGHPFYEYKIKNFLTESTLGMTPEKIWTGTYDATGGIILVKDNGDLVCYHIYNKNEFQNYLINKTKIEEPATGEDDINPGFAKTLKPKPYKFGWVYEENKELFIKLNLQIRFT
ncbi:MAG: HpaII family restriction endonuclease [bacterium]